VWQLFRVQQQVRAVHDGRSALSIAHTCVNPTSSRTSRRSSSLIEVVNNDGRG
jgi:hypothetical protein